MQLATFKQKQMLSFQKYELHSHNVETIPAVLRRQIFCIQDNHYTKWAYNGSQDTINSTSLFTVTLEKKLT